MRTKETPVSNRRETLPHSAIVATLLATVGLLPDVAQAIHLLQACFPLHAVDC